MAIVSDQQEVLQEFLTEATELLDDVDMRLVALERAPADVDLLNRVFRGFHTVKGGAGFLEITALVDLCHKGEDLLDALRKGRLKLTPAMMDPILAATAEVRRMFGELQDGSPVQPAPAALLQALANAHNPSAPEAPKSALAARVKATAGAPDWKALLDALLGTSQAQPAATAQASSPVQPVAAAPDASAGAPSAARKESQPTAVRETTLRVDTGRFDQILNLSGEIGLTRNRLSCISAELRAKVVGVDLGALEQTVGRLDTLVSDLQVTIMKARMQPVGRVFQKYVRMARDLGRQLGKDVELVIEGEETEIDKTMLEELNDPLVHLLRNAFDHGVEKPEERVAAGKSARGTVNLSARQQGDHIMIEISDDGRGMRPEVLRAKAVEKGVLSAADAARMDDRESLNLIFLPGFSTSAQISNVSGRGVGMDVVKTNIGRLKGRIDIASVPGKGSRMTIVLPLTLAILPALMLEQNGQPYAIPLSIVREVVGITAEQVQQVGGRPVMVMRGEVLPVTDLRELLGIGYSGPADTGVIVALPTGSVVLRAGRVLGQDEVMVKPLEGVKPRGVAGATLAGSGELVLVLELQELLEQAAQR